MNFNRLTKIIYIAVTSMTLCSTLALLLSFILSFDSINGYFDDGALPILFKVTFVLGIILSFASPFVFRKCDKIKSGENSTSLSFAYAFFAACLALCSILFNIFTASKYFTIATIGVCFFAFYVIMYAFKEGYKYSPLKPLLLLLSAIFPIIITIDNNSVIYRHSNSVENILTSVFGIAFLIYILYEGKRIFTGAHSKWHFTSMLLLSHVGTSLSVSYIVAYIFGSVNEKTRMYQMILIFIISIIGELKLISFIKSARAEQSETSEQENQ